MMLLVLILAKSARDFSAGDVRYSQTDINKASDNLDFVPEYKIMVENV